ncbi:MAG: hypothetical protein ACTSO3_14765 [Candidatus Heimdallarchaeaceae archaeon]
MMNDSTKNSNILFVISFTSYVLFALFYLLGPFRSVSFGVEFFFSAYLFTILTTLLVFPFLVISFNNLRKRKLLIRFTKNSIIQLILYSVLILYFIIQFAILGIAFDSYSPIFDVISLIPMFSNLILLFFMNFIGVNCLSDSKSEVRNLRKKEFNHILTVLLILTITTVIIPIYLTIIILLSTNLLSFDSFLLLASFGVVFFIVLLAATFLYVIGFLVYNSIKYLRMRPEVESKNDSGNKKSKSIVWYQYSLTLITYLCITIYAFQFYHGLRYYGFEVVYQYFSVAFVILLFIWNFVLYFHIMDIRIPKKVKEVIK